MPLERAMNKISRIYLPTYLALSSLTLCHALKVFKREREKSVDEIKHKRSEIRQINLFNDLNLIRIGDAKKMRAKINSFKLKSKI